MVIKHPFCGIPPFHTELPLTQMGTTVWTAFAISWELHSHVFSIVDVSPHQTTVNSIEIHLYTVCLCNIISIVIIMIEIESVII